MMSFLRKAIADQSGQSMVLLAGAMFSLCAMAGLTLDVGHAYSVRTQLQNSVNASGLAAAGFIYNKQTADTDSAEKIAKDYADINKINGLTPVTTATTLCVKALLATGASCTTGLTNAVKVTESVDVPTTFMRIFGFNKMSVSATAQATWGSAQPYNVALIVDATPSMFVTDPYCPQSGATAEQCAMNGVQSMLSAINPCINGVKTCPAATSTNSVFRVALFAFPNISTADGPKDYCKASGSPTFQLYSYPALPVVGSTDGYGPGGSITYKTGGTSVPITYLITQHSADAANIDNYGFTSDYYLNTASKNLNPSSILVKAVGNGTTATCVKQPSGYTMPSNWGSTGQGITYQAGVIYAAQAALDAEQVQTTALGIKATNVIIFVSDGQANAPSMEFVSSAATITSGKGYVTKTGTGKYPDATQDCQQTIMAAQYAIAQGTRVYGVAYGTEAGGCAMDNKVVTTGTLNVPVSNPATPCQVMQDISAAYKNNPDQWYFYAEGASQATGCVPTKTSTTNIQNIFDAITSTLTGPRLIPNSVT
jgi:Flp pilus assembly protein TadG